MSISLNLPPLYFYVSGAEGLMQVNELGNIGSFSGVKEKNQKQAATVSTARGDGGVRDDSYRVLFTFMANANLNLLCFHQSIPSPLSGRFQSGHRGCLL